MPRPRKPKADAPVTKSNDFVTALQFVQLVTRDVGTINETHVHIKDGWITAYNGVLAAGHKCKEDIYACPQNKLIVEALTKCSENLSITQLDNNRLSIKSDKFKAIVPCVANDLLQVVTPDPACGTIDNRFKDAVDIVSTLTNENAQTIYGASILMNGKSVISTLSGLMIMEYWHGIDLPLGLVIPKSLVQVLSKIDKPLGKFGFSQSSITFYYEDESFVRSQLYAEQWPDVMHVLDQPSNQWPWPASFWDALVAVAPFSDGLVYFGQGMLQSHPDPHQGASYEVYGIPAGPVFSIKQLILIKNTETVDFISNNMLSFRGNNLRGCIAGRKNAT